MIAETVASIALAGAVVAVVAFKTWWSRKLELEFLTADERYHEQALQAPRPAEEWDTYSVTYRTVEWGVLTDTIAAESAVAAFNSVKGRSSDVALVEVVNLTDPSEYQRGAK